MNFDDTIVAPTTGSGSAAIAMLRVSGSDAIQKVNQIFDAKRSLLKQKPYTMAYGKIKHNDEIIDEVVLGIYHGPHSFTGEDVIEISCHGSRYIQQKIIQVLNKNGVRLAEPGEFSLRAFKNGKIDLTQSEAIADLIASDSKASHRLAMNQLRGGVSNKMSTLRLELIRLTSLVELELDFSEEDVAFADRSALDDLVDTIQTEVSLLIKTFDYGNAIKNGIPVAIIGKPNAGKSTLLNGLLQEDRAIVSSIAGTTRDTLEEEFVIDGVRFKLIDTAGIRETEDEIEAIGVERAKQSVKKAMLVLYLFNPVENTKAELTEHLKEFQQSGTHFILIQNKIDKGETYLQSELLKEVVQEFNVPSIMISAHAESDLHKLQKLMLEAVEENAVESDIIISNARHKNALVATQNALQEFKDGMAMDVPMDLLSQHLREAIHQLGTITGEIEVDRDILGSIFSSFCIGK